MLLYYPPLFHVTAEPGTFRLQEYANPMSAVLMPMMEGGRAGGFVSGVAAPAASPQDKQFDRMEQLAKLQDADAKEKKDATQALLDSFRAKSSAGKVTGILPINVAFPAFGPSIYLVSELTGEGQSPAAEFSFARDKKGGVR